MTYARARLRLGIACVGTFVVLSTVLLATGTPHATLPTSTSWAWSDLRWLALLVVLYAAISAPFDLLGGHLLPRRYDRPVVTRGYGRVWVRGVLAHGASLFAVGLALLAGGRAGGGAGSLAVALVLMIGLLALQVPLAVLIGGARRSGGRLQASDPSFVGGVVGLPGRERVFALATLATPAVPLAPEGDAAVRAIDAAQVDSLIRWVKGLDPESWAACACEFTIEP